MLLWSFFLLVLGENTVAQIFTKPSPTTTTTTAPTTTPHLTTAHLVISGKPVAVAGGTVSVRCSGTIRNIYWFRLNESTGKFQLVTKHAVLNLASVESSGKYMCSNESIRKDYSLVIQLTIVEKLSPLQLVATPSYPIVAGQRVKMHCFASTMPAFVNWSWHRLESNDTWTAVGSGRDLTLTEPQESGQYHCRARSVHVIVQESLSPRHTVYIVPLPTTVGENLGIAAFAISLLASILLLIILIWLYWQRASETLNTTHTTAKDFSGPDKSPKGDLPQAEASEVYMNYTNTNEAYTDLDPTYLTGDNVYSSLS